jgi:urea transporter
MTSVWLKALPCEIAKSRHASQKVLRSLNELVELTRNCLVSQIFLLAEIVSGLSGVRIEIF